MTAPKAGGTHLMSQPADDPLVGTWTLAHCAVLDGGGAEIATPLGGRPEGRLLHTADGQVSVHAMAAGRPRCTANSLPDASATEMRAAADTYFGYAGTWSRDGDTVHHQVTVGSFPSWCCAELVRRLEPDDDRLVLTGSAAPADPRAADVVLTWERTTT